MCSERLNSPKNKKFKHVDGGITQDLPNREVGEPLETDDTHISLIYSDLQCRDFRILILISIIIYWKRGS